MEKLSGRPEKLTGFPSRVVLLKQKENGRLIMGAEDVWNVSLIAPEANILLCAIFFVKKEGFPMCRTGQYTQEKTVSAVEKKFFCFHSPDRCHEAYLRCNAAGSHDLYTNAL